MVNLPDPLPLPPTITFTGLIFYLSVYNWFRSTRDLLQQTIGSRPVRSMVCLGIGSMQDSVAARIQFAVAILLARHFRVERASVTVYDPVMTPSDIELVQSYGFTVGTNALDFHVPQGANETILLFMPYLPVDTVEEVLFRIMRESTLHSAICLGNSLTFYANQTTNGVSNRPRWFRELVESQGYNERSCDGFEPPIELFRFRVITF